MRYMFLVRSSPCLALQYAVEPSPARCLRRRRLPPCGLPARTYSPRIVCRPFCSAVRVSVQSAADFRYVRRHKHARHVLGTLRACPVPSLQSSPLLHSHAACAAVAHRLPSPGPHIAPNRMPSFRISAGREGVQPATDSRHVQRQRHELDVIRALLPCCPHNYVVGSFPARSCLHRRPLVSWPAPRPAPCALLSARQDAREFNQPLTFNTSSVTDMSWMFYVRPQHAPCALLSPQYEHLIPHRMPSVRLSAGRVGVQSAAELRHVQRHRYKLHVLGTLRS